MKIFLIGTDHGLQVGVSDAPEGCYAEFENLIHAAATTNSVKLIAEELSAAFVGENRSLCDKVAGELGIAHMFCDPNNRERETLGLPKIDDRKTWGPREEHWLSRLEGVEFPILFVCGANHVLSFSKKCLARGISVVVLEDDWKPDDPIPLEHRPI